MSAKVDMARSLAAFTARVDQHVADARAGMLSVYQIAMMIAITNIIIGGRYSPGTPRDKGFAQNSWYAGINGPGQPRQPSTNHLFPGESIPFTALEAAHEVVTRAGLGDAVTLMSNCVYIRPLEFGHSGQAPTGMVRITAAAWTAIVGDASRMALAQGKRGRRGERNLGVAGRGGFA